MSCVCWWNEQGEVGDGEDILVRVHSECLAGDIFGSATCECGKQLTLAMQRIEAAGRGVFIYLRGHQGRGVGLPHKHRPYNDSREYGIGAQVWIGSNIMNYNIDYHKSGGN